MKTGTTEQNILFNERFIGARVARFMAAFGAIAAFSYAGILVNGQLSGGRTPTIVLGFAVAIMISLTVGMALVLWIINRMTQSYLSAKEKADIKE